jgi:hypothetical protein
MIENAVRLDDLRIRIRKQWIVNLVAVGEKFQNLFGIVADGRQFDSLLFESRNRALQLDQLPFAEGSPVR